LAHDDVLLAPLEAFEYARDLPARLFIDGSLQSERFLVREVFEDDNRRALQILGPQGVFGLVGTVDGGSADGTLDGAVSVTGEFEVSGLSRGRKTGVLTLSDATGTRYRLLIGP
jgi:hypothetical protein